MVWNRGQRGFPVKDDYIVTMWSVLGHTVFVETTLICVRMEAAVQNTLGKGMMMFPSNFTNRH